MKRTFMTMVAMVLLLGLAMGCGDSSDDNNGMNGMNGNNNGTNADANTATDQEEGADATTGSETNTGSDAIILTDTNAGTDTFTGPETSTGTDTGTTTDTSTGSDTTTGQTCEQCTGSACSQEINACQNNADCTGLYGCLKSCTQGDKACQNACIDKYPKGFGPMDKTQMCMIKNCSTQCQISSPCFDCIVGNCYNEVIACDDNQDCIDFELCAGKCAQGDQNCVQVCAGQHQTGAQIYMAEYNCLKNNGCLSKCM